MTVTFTFTPLPYQNFPEYVTETEVVEVSESQIEAFRTALPAYVRASAATVACHVARMRRLTRPDGRYVTCRINYPTPLP